MNVRLVSFPVWSLLWQHHIVLPLSAPLRLWNREIGHATSCRSHDCARVDEWAHQSSLWVLLTFLDYWQHLFCAHVDLSFGYVQIARMWELISGFSVTEACRKRWLSRLQVSVQESVRGSVLRSWEGILKVTMRWQDSSTANAGSQLNWRRN